MGGPAPTTMSLRVAPVYFRSIAIRMVGYIHMNTFLNIPHLGICASRASVGWISACVHCIYIYHCKNMMVISTQNVAHVQWEWLKPYRSVFCSASTQYNAKKLWAVGRPVSLRPCSHHKSRVVASWNASDASWMKLWDMALGYMVLVIPIFFRPSTEN